MATCSATTSTRKPDWFPPRISILWMIFFVRPTFRAVRVHFGRMTFAAIPVEAISAIYERFLKGSDKLEGAFYTPRFLAELVLDVALANSPSLLGLRCLDPACGSGIFLVGLFNRMAEEWKQANPERDEMTAERGN